MKTVGNRSLVNRANLYVRQHKSRHDYYTNTVSNASWTLGHLDSPRIRCNVSAPQLRNVDRDWISLYPTDSLSFDLFTS